MDWAQILVIILGIALAAFLILGIVLVSLLIKITRQIREVTSSAQRAVGSIESVVSNMSRITTPALAIRTALKYVKKYSKK